MENIIYTKYSYNRDPKFQCKTKILKNKNGEYYVDKSSYTKLANQHIANIYNNYQKLKEIYRENENLRVANCELLSDETVRFEYVEEKSLEAILDDYLSKRNYSSIIEEIKKYFEILKNSHNKCKFNLTNEFKEVFGTISLSSDLEAFSFSNIDVIFSNVKVKGESYCFIDYEWCFDFPVPVDYIIFRCIYWFINSQCRIEQFQDINLYKLFGFSEKEVEVYLAMEDAYQAYVKGTYSPEWEIKKELPTDTFLLEDIKNLKENIMTKIQVYEDRGEGFSEESSYIYEQIQKNGASYIDLHIPIHKDTKMIRIDPCVDPCILFLNKLSYTNITENNIDFEHNGVKLNDSILLFLEYDSKLVFKNISINSIDFEGYVIPLKKQSVCQLSDYVESITNERKEYQDSIMKLNNTVREFSDSINQYKVNVDGLLGHIDNLEKQNNQLKQKFNRIVQSKLFKLIGWHFKTEEVNVEQ